MDNSNLKGKDEENVTKEKLLLASNCEQKNQNNVTGSTSALGNNSNTNESQSSLTDERPRKSLPPIPGKMKPIRNIDDDEYEQDEDDDEDDDDRFYLDNIENDSKSITNGSINADTASAGGNNIFDEKDEIISDTNQTPISRKQISITNLAASRSSLTNDSSFEKELDVRNEECDTVKNAAPRVHHLPPHEKRNKTGKSQFYFDRHSITGLTPATSTASPPATDDPNAMIYLFKTSFDEKFVVDLKNVTGVYSSAYLNAEDLRSDTVNVNGRLVLTNYRLVYLPYTVDQQSDLTSLSRAFAFDKSLSLFSKNAPPLSINIPLSFIYEMRASVSSDKSKKVKSLLLSANNFVFKDLIIKCKNFMTNSFIFNEPVKNTEAIFKFVYSLTYYSNYQGVIHNRFHGLIKSLGSNKQLFDEYKKHQVDDDKNDDDDDSPLFVRKSYMIPSDLQQDLVACKCDGFMQIKPGYAEPIPGKFIIDTNMPFCVMPNSINDIIKRKRVVVNEANVYEFVHKSPPSAHQGVSMSLPGNARKKKTNRFSELLGTSPRASKQTVVALANSAGADKNIQFQQPVLAQAITSNPFYENRFPFWSYSHPTSGFSLIIVPECSHSTRQEDCNIIIKNYNSLLCDQIIKTKKNEDPSMVVNSWTTVSSVKYSEYEFFKFQTPLSSEKISASYLKLMNICSFKTIGDYQKENEASSFYTRLQSSKWLQHVSILLSLANRIAACLLQHNVFVEERRNNMDCACILSSLVKICMNPANRTIVGFENLIQKDWFLTGHQFYTRLQSPTQNNLDPDEYFSEANHQRRASGNSSSSMLAPNDSSVSAASVQSSAKGLSNDISPAFLLFLDCVFQMTLQNPTEFEFSELYLINKWDYACSGLSFTYSFNGLVDWFYYLNNQKFLDATSNAPIDSVSVATNKGSCPKFENLYLKYIFDANSLFWLDHLSSPGDSSQTDSIFLNKFYNPARRGNANDQLVALAVTEQIHALKFWSRCYLRWHEKYHAYNSHLQSYADTQTTDVTENTDTNDQRSIRPTRQPPPIPTKPKPLSSSTNQALAAANQHVETDKESLIIGEKKQVLHADIEQLTTF